MPLETYPNHHLDGDGGTDTAIAATSGRKVAQTVTVRGTKEVKVTAGGKQQPDARLQCGYCSVNNSCGDSSSSSRSSSSRD